MGALRELSDLRSVLICRFVVGIGIYLLFERTIRLVGSGLVGFLSVNVPLTVEVGSARYAVIIAGPFFANVGGLAFMLVGLSRGVVLRAFDEERIKAVAEYAAALYVFPWFENFLHGHR